MDQSGSTGDPGTPPTSGWAAPPAPIQAGPEGFVYADVPNRAIAYIIDAIIIAIAASIVGIILAGIGLSTGQITGTGTDLNFELNPVGLVISAVIDGAISAAYFIYTWTSMRGTIGMKALGMQIGNEGDGATLTQNQAIKRWIYVGGWISIAQIINPVPLLGLLVGIAGLVYVIYLLYTTAQSPTKQGYHDHQAHTMVVKATRTVA
jgi:uncharacterized RDD family membrane protein YckC